MRCIFSNLSSQDQQECSERSSWPWGASPGMLQWPPRWPQRQPAEIEKKHSVRILSTIFICWLMIKSTWSHKITYSCNNLQDKTEGCAKKWVQDERACMNQRAEEWRRYIRRLSLKKEVKYWQRCPGLQIQERFSGDTREKKTVQEESEVRVFADRKKMRVTKTSKVWIFVFTSHRSLARSYFVRVFTQQFVEMAQTPPHCSGHFAFVFFLLLNQEVIWTLLSLLLAASMTAHIHPAARPPSSKNHRCLFLALHIQQLSCSGLAGLCSL